MATAVQAYVRLCREANVPACLEFINALSTGNKECDLSERAIGATSSDGSTAVLEETDVLCIAEALRFPHSIRVLDLEGQRVGYRGLTSLLSALGYNPCIREVRIGRNQLGDPSLVALGNFLTTNGAGLRVLDLNMNGITKVGVVALCQAMGASRVCELSEVSFHGNLLDAECGMAIANAIRQSQKLKHLHLGYNVLKDAGTKDIAKSLSASRALVSLDLTGNDIGHVGGQELAWALLSCCSLQRLNCRHNLFTDDTFRLFGEVLLSKSQLTHLYLGYMKPSQVVAELVLRNLSKNTSIIVFDVMGWELGGRGGADRGGSSSGKGSAASTSSAGGRAKAPSGTNSSRSASLAGGGANAASEDGTEKSRPRESGEEPPAAAVLRLIGQLNSTIRSITTELFEGCEDVLHEINVTRKRRGIAPLYVGTDERASHAAAVAPNPPAEDGDDEEEDEERLDDGEEVIEGEAATPAASTTKSAAGGSTSASKGAAPAAGAAERQSQPRQGTNTDRGASVGAPRQPSRSQPQPTKTAGSSVPPTQPAPKEDAGRKSNGNSTVGPQKQQQQQQQAATNATTNNNGKTAAAAGTPANNASDSNNKNRAVIVAPSERQQDQQLDNILEELNLSDDDRHRMLSAVGRLLHDRVKTVEDEHQQQIDELEARIKALEGQQQQQQKQGAGAAGGQGSNNANKNAASSGPGSNSNTASGGGGENATTGSSATKKEPSPRVHHNDERPGPQGAKAGTGGGKEATPAQSKETSASTQQGAQNRQAASDSSSKAAAPKEEGAAGGRGKSVAGASDSKATETDKPTPAQSRAGGPGGPRDKSVAQPESNNNNNSSSAAKKDDAAAQASKTGSPAKTSSTGTNAASGGSAGAKPASATGTNDRSGSASPSKGATDTKGKTTDENKSQKTLSAGPSQGAATAGTGTDKKGNGSPSSRESQPAKAGPGRGASAAATTSSSANKDIETTPQHGAREDTEHPPANDGGEDDVGTLTSPDLRHANPPAPAVGAPPLSASPPKQELPKRRALTQHFSDHSSHV